MSRVLDEPDGFKPRLPFLQVWCDEALSGTAHMTAQEFGIYFRLLLHQHIRRGHLPADHQTLARLAVVTIDEFDLAWAVVGEKFVVLPDGTLQNPAMARKEAAREARAASLRAFGRRGAKARWDPQGNGQERGRTPREMAKNGQTYGRTMPPESRDQRPEKGPDVKTRSGGLGLNSNRTSTRGGGRGASTDPILPGMESPTKRKRAQPTGPHAELITWFVNTWACVHPGATYAVTAKDGVAAASLLKAAGAEEIHRRIGEMFRAKWPGPALTLSRAWGAWNEFAPGYNRPPANVREPTQKDLDSLREGMASDITGVAELAKHHFTKTTGKDWRTYAPEATRNGKHE